MATSKVPYEQVNFNGVTMPAGDARAQIETMTPDARMTPSETALLLGVSTIHFEKLRDINLGPAYHSLSSTGGEGYRYIKKDVEAWAAAVKSGTPVPKSSGRK